MRIVKCLLNENDCYKTGRRIKPQGVMVHSTGANNPRVSRYVQPADDDAALLEILGRNKNGNDWNRPGVKKCAHAFIGLLGDGTVGTVQTLPWDARGWHAGSGERGSANNTHISFEICEDGLIDPDYFAGVYREAVELTAMLCSLYGLDPLADGAVICHAEGHRRGVASGHTDVEHWFPRFGKTMDDFRADTARAMEPEVPPEDGEKEEEKLTGEEIARKLQEYLSAQPVPEWAEKELREAVELGITDGSDPTALIPRYQAAILALRAAKKGGAGR